MLGVCGLASRAAARQTRKWTVLAKTPKRGPQFFQKATRRVVLPRMPDRGRNSPASLDAEIRHRRDRGPASGSVWVNQDRLVPWVLGAAI